MEAVERSQQQRARVAELPENYRLVGSDHSTPLVRKPPGRIMRIQQNGRLMVATIAAQRRLVATTSAASDTTGDVSWHESL